MNALGKGLESLIPQGSGKAPDEVLAGAGDLAGKSNIAHPSPVATPATGSEENVTYPHTADGSSEDQGKTVLQQNTHAQDSQKTSRAYPYATRKEAVFHIEVEKIKPNPHQPRREFNQAALRELADSIREFGILQPLVVTKKEYEVPGGTEVEYELIAGERRLLAAKMLGLTQVPAIIRKVGADRERLEMAIIENLQREDLNPIESARAFSRLQEEFHLTQREIAARLGKSRESIANTMRLLDLPSEIQEALAKGKISESHGRLLLAISEPALQKQIFQELLEHKITTRELRERVARSIQKESSPQRQRRVVSPELKILEEKLSSELGAPVVISHVGKRGKIIINFYSEEELRNIVQQLGLDEDQE